MSQNPEQDLNIPCTCENPDFLPHYASDGAAGADVRAAIEGPVTLQPGSSILIPTGIRCAIPKGFEIQVRPRSGLAFKHQITVLNTPGTIDSDYRGEIGVILINHGKKTFEITPGMRIAQLVVAPIIMANFSLANTENLMATARGNGGFGHSGLH